MPVAAKKNYQNTTVRVPRHIFDRAKTVIDQAKISSFNEFVVQAIEEKVQRLTEAEIDAAFAQMADDEDYRRNSVTLAGEFAKSDWEAFNSGDMHERSKVSSRTSKTRSRRRV